MALIRKPTASSSSAPQDEINPWKIKAQMIRMWKGNRNESGPSIDMVLLDSSGTSIQPTIDVSFSKWVQDIGDEKINESNTGDIDILEDLVITHCNDPFNTIIRRVYGESFAEFSRPDFFQEKVILCPTDDDVDKINDYMLSQLPGEEKLCLSVDSISPSDSQESDYWRYPLEFLNSIKVPGLPNHSLRLKVGVPVILTQDIMPNKGLCIGARLQITRMDTFSLGARILTGAKTGETVLLPRIYTYPTDEKFPFKMRRKQYPVAVSFAMTISKHQGGQSLSKIGIYQPRRMFSHGRQLYVAISKAKTRDGLKVLITNNDRRPNEETTNVVFKEVGVSE